MTETLLIAACGSEKLLASMRTEDFIARYPRLFHMAEVGTWPKIKAGGLLSTSAVLDRYGIVGPARRALEELHRPAKVQVGTSADHVVLRDQRPMHPDRLKDALVGGLTPTQWYKLLNGKVFLWAAEHRLLGLLKARHYRALEHDVLTLDTASLMSTHAHAVWLCPMNSGNTFPMPHARSLETFKRVPDYPANARGRPHKEVVEVVVDYGILDIAQHVVEVRRMKGEDVLAPIPL